jgi:predicted alpha/beta hydrolase family esterase
MQNFVRTVRMWVAPVQSANLSALENKMKRVFIIHGWGGNPDEGWFPWLKKELEAKGIEVQMPAMPGTDHPKIDTWVSFLAQQVGTPDSDTYFVGHSIGCQAILRYLEAINNQVGGSVHVAGWFTLMNQSPDEIEIAEPWISRSINYEKARENCPKFIGIFSDNDDVVPQENQKFFEERLGAITFLESGKGHFSGSDGVIELPIVLEQLEQMIQ